MDDKKINDSKTEFIIFRSPLLKQNFSERPGVFLTSISLFMIILVVFASLLIFTCVASEEFGTF